MPGEIKYDLVPVCNFGVKIGLDWCITRTARGEEKAWNAGERVDGQMREDVKEGSDVYFWLGDGSGE